MLIGRMRSPARTPAAVPATGDHALLAAEMERQIAQRSTDLLKLESFLSLDVVRRAFGEVKLDAGLVRKAVKMLGDDELARLASQTDRVRTDIESGQLLSEQLTYVVVALAAVVVILLTITP